MKSKRLQILVAAVVLFLSVSPVMAVIGFKDGLTHDIDYQINDSVWVDYESPGLGTTLNILDGATIPPNYHIKGWEDSIINILGGSMNVLSARGTSRVAVSGGLIGSLGASGSSQVNVSGGSIGGLAAHNTSEVAVSGGLIDGRLYAYDSSQVTVSGGSINDYFYALGSSEVTVSGGLIDKLGASVSSQVTVSGGSTNYLFAYDSSQVTVSGGSINDYFYALGSGQVAVSGGSINYLVGDYSGQIAISGGLIGEEMLVKHTAVLTIDGWDFAVDGMPVGYTELYSIFGGTYRDEPYRQLTGTLLSGDPVNDQFRIGNSGKIVLVPEPATLLLLGFGGLALLRKRRG